MVSNGNNIVRVRPIGQSSRSNKVELIDRERARLFSFPSAGGHQQFFVFWGRFDKYRILWGRDEKSLARRTSNKDSLGRSKRRTYCISNVIQSREKVLVRGCEKFLPALALLFCLTLPGCCLARFAKTFSQLCSYRIFLHISSEDRAK